MRNKFLTIKSSLTFFIALLDNRLGLIVNVKPCASH